MSRPLHSLAGVVLAFVLGMLGWFTFGTGPQASAAAPAQGDGWALPVAAAAKLDAPAKVWEKRQPWGPPPAVAQDAAAVPEPVAIPVGTATANGRLVAVFLSPDGSVVRVRPGQEIAGGGRLVAVTRFHVSWTDARGTKHEQELLADPLPSQVPLP